MSHDFRSSISDGPRVRVGSTHYSSSSKMTDSPATNVIGFLRSSLVEKSHRFTAQTKKTTALTLSTDGIPIGLYSNGDLGSTARAATTPPFSAENRKSPFG